MFRFTIRELILLTLVVAMGAGWWLNWGQLRKELIVKEAEIVQLREDIAENELKIQKLANTINGWYSKYRSQKASPQP